MPHTSIAVANGFLTIAGMGFVDPLKIQKLVYFAHGWHLGFDMGPLSSENARAWRWGPVFPKLYYAVRSWGNTPIGELIVDLSGRGEVTTRRVPSSDNASKLIERVWEVYGDQTGLSLSHMTHVDDGPWKETRDDAPDALSPVIPDSLICNYFKGLIS